MQSLMRRGTITEEEARTLMSLNVRMAKEKYPFLSPDGVDNKLHTSSDSLVPVWLEVKLEYLDPIFRKLGFCHEVVGVGAEAWTSAAEVPWDLLEYILLILAQFMSWGDTGAISFARNNVFSFLTNKEPRMRLLACKALFGPLISSEGSRFTQTSTDNIFVYIEFVRHHTFIIISSFHLSMSPSTYLFVYVRFVKLSVFLSYH